MSLRKFNCKGAEWVANYVLLEAVDPGVKRTPFPKAASRPHLIEFHSEKYGSYSLEKEILIPGFMELTDDDLYRFLEEAINQSRTLKDNRKSE